MTARIGLSAVAREQLLAVDAWWRANRPSSPSLFLKELRDAMAAIAQMPVAGQPYPHAELENVRRVLLKKTRKHVYYVPGKELVVVLAIWNSVGDTQPDLSL